jgi:methyl-accepting chemotaxis protein
MGFKTRLILANALFALGLASSVAIMFAYSSMQQDYEELVLRTHRLKTAMYATSSQLKSALFNDELEASYESFRNRYEQFHSGVQELVEDPLFRNVIQELEYGAADTESLVNVLAMNHDRIGQIDTLVEELTADQSAYLPGPMKAKTQLELFPGKQQAISDASDAMERAARYFGGAMETHIDQIIGNIETAADQSLSRLRLIALSLAGAVLLFVSIFTFLIIRLLRVKLTSLRDSLQILSSGDFSHRIHTSGRDELSELGATVNSFIEEFCVIIGEAKTLSQESSRLKDKLSESTAQSADATRQMRNNVGNMSDRIKDLVENMETSREATGSIAERISALNGRIEHQSSSVTQSSTSVEEMNASIENVSTISDKRREAADSLSHSAAATGEKMNETNRLIEENAGDVNAILDVISIINNVASQTNLLSMNAAIEAAHAGDAGRGFAVVAEEIRSLAETTNSNSKKIRHTINTIADRISSITDMSRDTREAFQQISEETGRSSESMTEISASMQELSQGSREIMEAMNSLSQITQEIHEGAGEMQEQTDRVNTSIDEIRAIGDEVNQGIRQIASAAEEIDASMQHINKINAESRRFIERLEHTVSRFKTGDSENSGSSIGCGFETAPETDETVAEAVDGERRQEEPEEAGVP